jgi:DNA-binding MarR family transcriptional regulator
MLVTSPPTEDTLQRALDKFWEAFLPTWRTIRTHIRETAAQQYDISEEQFHILRHVAHGLDSASELAEARGISRPAVSQSVDLLVQKGLLTRSHVSIDRRFVRLALTDSGKALLDGIFNCNRQWMHAKLGVLGEDDLQGIITAMENLFTVFVHNPNA